MANRFVLNETSYHGPGAIREIAGEVKGRGFKKCFVCSDPDLIKFNVTKKVTDVLENAGIDYEIYSKIKANPTVENVQTGVAAFKASGADCIIAIGGGSSMDTAKAIGIIIENPEFSDVISLEGVAPKGLTAATGMDALTHAIEGYITKAAWEMSDMFHLKAIEIISKNLRGAVANTPEGREGMALGQYIAGMGFSNVGLGIVHSMAHPLGAVYDTPHGVANAIILPTVMAYNAPATGEKYRDIAKAMGVKGVDDMTLDQARAAAVDAVKQLSQDVGIPADLKDIVKPEDVDFLAQSAYDDACRPGNPRDTSVEEIKQLYLSLM